MARWDANTAVACLPDAGILQLEAPLLLDKCTFVFAAIFPSYVYVQNCYPVFLFQLPSYASVA